MDGSTGWTVIIGWLVAISVWAQEFFWWLLIMYLIICFILVCYPINRVWDTPLALSLYNRF